MTDNFLFVCRVRAKYLQIDALIFDSKCRFDFLCYWPAKIKKKNREPFHALRLKVARHTLKFLQHLLFLKMFTSGLSILRNYELKGQFSTRHFLLKQQTFSRLLLKAIFSLQQVRQKLMVANKQKDPKML